MRYENEKCPVCGENFKASDDVVVCPECATPHHRACFAESGKCANEHLHADGFLWQKAEVPQTDVKTEEAKPESESKMPVCPYCQSDVKPNALICPHCGAILKAEIEAEFLPKNSNVFIDGQPVDDMDFIDAEKTVTVGEAAHFIQRSKESYIKTFLDAKVNSRRPKFNFASLLFGPYWFFFRKIYKSGFIYSGILFAIKCCTTALSARAFSEAIAFLINNMAAFESSSVSSVLISEYSELIVKGIETHPVEVAIMFALSAAVLIIRIAVGFFANGVYLNHIKTIVKKIKNVIHDPRTYYTYIYAKGGTTVLNAIFLCIAIYYLSELIVSYALM